MSEQVPEGWMKTTIGSVTQEINTRVGGRKGVRVLSSTKHYGLIPSDEYFKNRTIYSSDTSNYKLVREGVFAYATNHLAEGSIGYQDRFDEACVSPIYTVFSCDARVYGYYFFRLLKSARFLALYKLHEQASVDRRGAIRYSDFSKIPLFLPPLIEQQWISEILDSVDESITASVDVIDKLSRLRKSALAGLIGRGFMLAQEGIEQAEGTTYRGGSQDAVSEEERWRLLPCAEVLKLAGGSPALIGENREGNFAVYGGNGVIGYVDHPLVGGDVLIIGRVGQYSGAVYYSDSPVWVTDNALYSRMVYGDWDKRFLALYFKWFDLRKSQSLNDNPLVTQASISRVPVAQPPLKEQKRIVSIIEAHDERIAAEKARLEKLRKLKAGLMDDLLTGRVRVNQLDELPV